MNMNNTKLKLAICDMIIVSAYLRLLEKSSHKYIFQNPLLYNETKPKDIFNVGNEFYGYNGYRA